MCSEDLQLNSEQRHASLGPAGAASAAVQHLALWRGPCWTSTLNFEKQQSDAPELMKVSMSSCLAHSVRGRGIHRRRTARHPTGSASCSGFDSCSCTTCNIAAYQPQANISASHGSSTAPFKGRMQQLQGLCCCTRRCRPSHCAVWWQST
jgi:hypothetical protein